MNNVSLIGNLASEVDLKEVGDKQVANFLLAIDRPGKDAGGAAPNASRMEATSSDGLSVCVIGRRFGLWAMTAARY